MISDQKSCWVGVLTRDVSFLTPSPCWTLPHVQFLIFPHPDVLSLLLITGTSWAPHLMSSHAHKQDILPLIDPGVSWPQTSNPCPHISKNFWTSFNDKVHGVCSIDWNSLILVMKALISGVFQHRRLSCADICCKGLNQFKELFSLEIYSMVYFHCKQWLQSITVHW